MHSALLLAIAALPFLGADAAKINTTLRCGAQSKDALTCKGSVFGSCCSKSGVCGFSALHCGKGCQVGFGDCSNPVKSSSVSAKSSSTSKRSLASSATTTVVSIETASTFLTPSAISITSTSTTSSSTPTASSPSPSDVKVSTDGSCGGAQGFTCLGSPFGNCCSEYGWCGSTSVYCDAGCNAVFGKCNSASTPIQSPSSTAETTSSSLTASSFITSTITTSATPSSTQAVSTDGGCGASSNGMTCLGSQFGDCCSQYSYCGSTGAFCGTGCQSGFGKCDTAPEPGKICGVEGFANIEAYYASSFNLISTSDVSTCANLCLAEATCQSYLFNVGLQNCAYLTYSLSEGEFIATTGTDQLFWDRSCAEASAA